MTHRRAIALVELMATLLLSAVIMILLSKVLVDGIKIEHLAAERLHRRATADTFLDRLRADALHAESFTWQGTDEAFILTLAAREGASKQEVGYNFLGGAVTRTIEGRQTDAWKAPRLIIEANVSKTCKHPLLDVNFVELPPARKRDALPRETHILVNMPQQQTEIAR